MVMLSTRPRKKRSYVRLHFVRSNRPSNEHRVWCDCLSTFNAFAIPPFLSINLAISLSLLIYRLRNHSLEFSLAFISLSIELVNALQRLACYWLVLTLVAMAMMPLRRNTKRSTTIKRIHICGLHPSNLPTIHPHTYSYTRTQVYTLTDSCCVVFYHVSQLGCR